MAQYDGIIRVNTKIDSGDFLKGLKKMSSQSKKLNNSISETTSQIDRLQKEIKELQDTPAGDTPAVSNIKNSISDITGQINRLKEEIKELQDTPVRDTLAIINIKNSISDTIGAIDNVKKELSDLSNLPLNSNEISKYETAWNNADQKYMELTRKREQLEKELSNAYGPNMQFDMDNLQSLFKSNEEWKKITDQIAKAEIELDKYEVKLDHAKAAERSRRDNVISKKVIDLQKASKKLDDYNAKLKKTQEVEQSKRDTAIAKKSTALQKAINKLEVYQAKLSEINGSESGIAKKLSHISDVAKGGFGNLTKNTAKSNNMLNKLSGSVTRFSKRIWGLLSSALVFSVLRKAFTALREKMAEAVKQNAQFNASMSKIRGNMNSAFNDLLSAAMPALNTIINAIARATSYLSAFIALLTGKTVKSSNAAADAANNQAAAVGGVGEAAKKASEYLNSYDEMNVQTSKDSSGGGGGGAGADISYEDTDVKSQVADFLDRIKDAWKDADFTDFGRIVGDKINDSLEKIDWTKIKNTSYKIGKSVATFLNGVFETPDLFTNIGSTVAESLNTAIALSLGFAENFHWDSFGQALADSINSFFETFDFGNAANSVNKWLKGVLKVASELLKGTDFELIGNKVGEFLEELDFSGCSEGMAKVIWEAIKGGFSMLTGVFEEAPLETSLIAAFAILKFSGLGSAIAGKISTVIGTYLSTNGLSLALTGIGLYASLEGIKVALTGETNLKNTIESTILTGWGTFTVTKDVKLALEVSVAIASYKLGNYLYENVPPVQKWADLIAESIVGVFDGTLSLKDVLDKTAEFQIDLLADIGNILFPDGEKFTKENVLDRIYKKVFGQDKNFNYDKSIAYNVAVGIATTINEFAGKVSGFIGNVPAQILLIAIGIGTTLNEFKQKVQEKIDGIGQKVVNVKAAIATKAGDLWTSFKNSWGDKRTLSAKLGIATKISSIWNTIKRDWNKVKGKLQFPIKVPHFSWGTTTKKILGKAIQVPDLKINWYANGGFPDMGQLFIARERGAEMVGNIGGKTAVANNDQITSAIAEAVGPAVYEAVTAAMANSSNGTGDIAVYVGGQKITDFVIKDVRNRTIASGGINPLLV